MTQSTALTAARAGGLAVFANGVNPFLSRPKEEGVNEGAFLRMDGRTGEYKGSNDIKIDHGTQMVFDLFNAIEAWQGFDKQSKLVKGPEAKFKDGLPCGMPDETLEGVKWQKIFRFQVRTLDGSPPMTYTAKADKPTREIWKLIKRYGEQMSRNVDAEGKFMLPLIEIGASPFSFDTKEKKVVPNKKTGQDEIVEEDVKVTVYFEKFPIIGWISEAEIDEMTAAAAEADVDAVVGEVVQESAPAPQQVAAPAPAPAPAEIVVPAAELKPAPAAAKPVGAAARFSQNRAGGRV